MKHAQHAADAKACGIFAVDYYRLGVQPPDKISDETKWMAIIARCLAFLCLDKADLRTEKISAQAEFLERLGLNRHDSAQILNTSAESLRVLARLHKDKKGRRSGRKK
jgi:hypothetical protein